MIIGKDERTEIYVGKGFQGDWDFKNLDGTPMDLAAITSAKAILRNISPQFSSDPVYEVGSILVQPGGEIGRVRLTLNPSDTSKFKIPTNEKNPFTSSDIYGKLLLVDQADTPFLEINVALIKV